MNSVALIFLKDLSGSTNEWMCSEWASLLLPQGDKTVFPTFEESGLMKGRLGLAGICIVFYEIVQTGQKE